MATPDTSLDAPLCWRAPSPSGRMASRLPAHAKALLSVTPLPRQPRAAPRYGSWPSIIRWSIGSNHSLLGTCTIQPLTT